MSTDTKIELEHPFRPHTTEEWRAECDKWNLTELGKFSQSKINRLWTQWCAPPMEIEFLNFDHPRYSPFYQTIRGRGPNNGVVDDGLDDAERDEVKDNFERGMRYLENAMETEAFTQVHGTELLEMGGFFQSWGVLHTHPGTLGRWKTLTDKYMKALAEEKMDFTVCDPFELCAQYLKIYDILLHEGDLVEEDEEDEKNEEKKESEKSEEGEGV